VKLADFLLRLNEMSRSWIPTLVCVLVLVLVVGWPHTGRKAPTNAYQTSIWSAAEDGAPGEAPNDPPVIQKQVNEVQMLFTVKDKHGRLVPDLTASNFSVLDGGYPVDHITTFAQVSGLPLRVGILVDGSDSMQKAYGAEQRAAVAFIRQSLDPERDHAMLSVFASSNASTLGTMLDAQLLKAHFQPQPGGQTALYDAVLNATRHRVLSGNEASSVRRVLLLFSDGEDNYSRSTLEDSIEALQRQQIAVYAVSVHSRRLEYPGDPVLRMLAEATGGKVLFLSRYDQLPLAFESIERELRTQYLLGFIPPRTGASGFHRVNIIPENGHHLYVVARGGYYASR
jgi:Ca-activated chloride channel family protein